MNKFVTVLLPFVLGLVLSVPVHAQDINFETLTEWEELNVEILSLYRQGRYGRAMNVAEKALEIAKQKGGQNHPTVALSLNNLALLHKTKGKYAEAERYYKLSLTLGEAARGPEHPSVARTLNNLAALYETQGQYAKAEPFYKRSLAIKERTLGPEHPSVALSLNNLAELYKNQGKYVQAEPLYKRSLAIREKALGPAHPTVALSLDNLAELYKAQGRYAQAESLYKQSLAIRKKTLDPKHPSVATSLKNLTELQRIKNRLTHTRTSYTRSQATSLVDWTSSKNRVTRVREKKVKPAPDTRPSKVTTKPRAEPEPAAPIIADESSRQGRRILSVGRIGNAARTSDNKRQEINSGSQTFYTFSRLSIPADSVIKSVVVYVEHFEQEQFPEEKLQWNIGTGWPGKPEIWASINAPVYEGEPNEATDIWDITSVVDTLKKVNSLQLQIKNNYSHDNRKTFVDYVYAKVEWGIDE
ncbi:MAG: tetratricopeptide repeat protein [Phycisphaerales bacterium]